MNILQFMTGREPLGVAATALPRTKSLGFALLRLLTAVLMLGLLAAIMLPRARAQDRQGYPQTFGVLTNVPATVNTNASVTVTNIIPIRNYSGLGVQVSFNANSGTSNVVWQIYASIDGTNFSTTPWTTWIINANGTTTVTANTNWDGNRLKGIAALNFGSQTNQNAGTITNGATIWNRPNS